LGLYKSRFESGSSFFLAFNNLNILICSWISFALSVLSILCGFLVGALALRKEVAKVGDALTNKNALERRNYWTTLEYIIYIFSGISFIAGITFLLIFCATNIAGF
jgi:hypothetical protein